LIDLLPDIISALSLGNYTANLRKLNELFNRSDDLVSKATGVARRVLGTIGMQVADIGACPS